MRGEQVDVPFWVHILEAAGNDPLKAQEWEQNLSAEWWHYWVSYNNERAEVIREKAAKAKKDADV
jgi:hypothetical protein